MQIYSLGCLKLTMPHWNAAIPSVLAKRNIRHFYEGLESASTIQKKQSASCDTQVIEEQEEVIVPLQEVFPFPGLFHMESMEWMLAETPANFLFHGHHGLHVE